MDFLFDAPWWLYVIPALIGVVMAFLGLRKADNTLRNVGLATLLLGLGVFIASKAVETDTEKVARQSRELVASVEKREWEKLSGFLEPGAAVSLANVPGEIYTSREQIVHACQSRVDASGVSTLAVTSVEAKRDGAAQISVEIQIYVTAIDTFGNPVPTEWRLVWERASDGKWLVHDIVAIRIANSRAGEARNWFPSTK